MFAKVRNITGYFPCRFLYFSASCPKIESPSNRSDLPSYFLEKKHSSILMFNVLPKQRGRVISVTVEPFSHHSLINSVLSI